MPARPLETLGLSPNEATCYEALVRHGSSSANELARATGIHRVSVYDALRGLTTKGLVSQMMKTNRMLFEAASPQRLLEVAEEKEEELHTAQDAIQPLLSAFAAAKERQEIHTFKGTAGIKTILWDMLRTRNEILDFGAEYRIKEFLPHDYPHWERERVRRRIPMRIVANRKIKPVRLPLTKIRYVPERFHSTVSTYIYGNKVALTLWTHLPLGVLIEHSEAAISYRNYFSYLWSKARP